MTPRPPRPTLFPYTTLFRSERRDRDPAVVQRGETLREALAALAQEVVLGDPASLEGQLVGVARSPSQLPVRGTRSEEHTSELQSQSNLVCRLLLEKKKV